MKKLWIPFTAVLFVFSTVIFAQTSTSTGVIGKLYTKDQANQIYGPVLQSISINTSSLKAMTARTPKYIMFNILNGQLYILNSDRTVMSGAMTNLSASQPMRLFSTSIVNQLVQQGNSSNTTIELRADNIITITNGDVTLEQAVLCPPACP